MPALRSLFIVVLFVLNLVALAAILISVGQPQPKGEPERITNQINPDRIALQAAGNPFSPPKRQAIETARTGVSEAARQAPAAPPAPTPPAARMAAASPADAQAPPPIEMGAPAENRAPAVSSLPADPPALRACLLYEGLNQEQADALAGSAGSLSGELRTERDAASVTTAWWVRLPPTGSREAADRKVRELRDAGIRDYFVFRDGGQNQFAVSLGLFSSEAGARQHVAFLERKRIAGAQILPRNSTIHRLQVSGPATILETLNAQFQARHPGVAPTPCNP